MRPLTLPLLLVMMLLPVCPCLAGGMIPLEPAAYVERASEAIESELARGQTALAVELAELLESGAYDREAGIRRSLTQRVRRALASEALLSPLNREGLEALRDRIGRASEERHLPAARQPIRLPADEAGHRKLAEWWYLNGHLAAEDGRTYGYELTFFHVRPGIFFVHTAVTDIAGRRFEHSRRYLSPSACRIREDRLAVTYGDAAGLERLDDGRYRIHMEVADSTTLKLDLTATRSPMHVNGDGLIDMPEGTFSWYYSITRLQATGTLTSGGKTVPVTGLTWMDHQWGNFVCLRIGWDWFAFQLDDGTDYNIFCFRSPDGRPLGQYVNRLDAAGNLTTSRKIGLSRESWWQSPHTGKRYVMRYRLSPEGEAPYCLEALLADQELPARGLDPAPTYWEGKSKVTRVGGQPLAGLAYCEQFPFPKTPAGPR